MEDREHWEEVYRRRLPDQVSWYRPHLEHSLAILRSAQLPPDASIIDVGGGASTFVDDVLEQGYSDITVLDLSETAIESSVRRLGRRASKVRWIIGDVTAMDLEPNRYDFWHDRAVFHFLVEQDARRGYVTAVHRSLKSNGHIVVATFRPGGPEHCSGLNVCRYDADGLHAEFGNEFMRVSSIQEDHITPWGTQQEFVYCYCRGPEHR